MFVIEWLGLAHPKRMALMIDRVVAGHRVNQYRVLAPKEQQPARDLRKTRAIKAELEHRARMGPAKRLLHAADM